MEVVSCVWDGSGTHPLVVVGDAPVEVVSCADDDVSGCMLLPDFVYVQGFDP